MSTSQKVKLYTELYEQHYPRLMKTLHTITFNHAAEREDIAQETFRCVWEAIQADKYDPHLCEPFTWIYAIAKNCSIRHHENTIRQLPPYYIDIADVQEFEPPEEADEEDESIFVRDPDDHEAGFVDMNTPESVYMREQEEDALEAAIRGLPEDYEVVVRLHYIEGLTYDLIAARLAVSPETVRTRLRRGRDKLKNFLGEIHDSEGSEGSTATEHSG